MALDTVSPPVFSLVIPQILVTGQAALAIKSSVIHHIRVRIMAGDTGEIPFSETFAAHQPHGLIADVDGRHLASRRKRGNRSNALLLRDRVVCPTRFGRNERFRPADRS